MFCDIFEDCLSDEDESSAAQVDRLRDDGCKEYLRGLVGGVVENGRYLFVLEDGKMGSGPLNVEFGDGVFVLQWFFGGRKGTRGVV